MGLHSGLGEAVGSSFWSYLNHIWSYFSPTCANPWDWNKTFIFLNLAKLDVNPNLDEFKIKKLKRLPTCSNKQKIDIVWSYLWQCYLLCFQLQSGHRLYDDKYCLFSHSLPYHRTTFPRPPVCFLLFLSTFRREFATRCQFPNRLQNIKQIEQNWRGRGIEMRVLYSEALSPPPHHPSKFSFISHYLSNPPWAPPYVEWINSKFPSLRWNFFEFLTYSQKIISAFYSKDNKFPFASFAIWANKRLANRCCGVTQIFDSCWDLLLWLLFDGPGSCEFPFVMVSLSPEFKIPFGPLKIIRKNSQ